MSIIYKGRCSMCSQSIEAEITEREAEDLKDVNKTIQQVFPKRDAFFREMFISKLCYECQSKLFNVPMPGDTSWGEVIGKCSCCGTNIYTEKNRDKSIQGKWICPTCSSKFTISDFN